MHAGNDKSMFAHSCRSTTRHAVVLFNNVVSRYDCFAGLRREFIKAFRDSYKNGNTSPWLIANVALDEEAYLIHPRTSASGVQEMTRLPF